MRLHFPDSICVFACLWLTRCLHCVRLQRGDFWSGNCVLEVSWSVRVLTEKWFWALLCIIWFLFYGRGGRSHLRVDGLIIYFWGVCYCGESFGVYDGWGVFILTSRGIVVLVGGDPFSAVESVLWLEVRSFFLWNCWWLCFGVISSYCGVFRMGACWFMRVRIEERFAQLHLF